MGSRLYGEYLNLDALLDEQHRLSEAGGASAHDEMLFIVVHQVYEIWFKQMLFEVGGALDRLSQDPIRERDLPWIVARLRRCNEIWRVLLDQLRVLETMTPMDFLDFRRFLGTMSGFQSYQFRMLENKLGLRALQRVGHSECPYHRPFSQQEQHQLLTAEGEPTLLSCLDTWLSRMPFLSHPSFDFVERYCEGVDAMVAQEESRLSDVDDLDEKGKATAIRGLHELRDRVARQLKNGERPVGRVISDEAFLAALFIRTYEEEPLFCWPAHLLRETVEFEGRCIEWRYRHSLMVLKMIGQKQGTGGSSGYEYLQETARKHQIFGDLHEVTTLLIPRCYLPSLSDGLQRELSFSFKGNP